MPESYYETLGVPKNASADELKKAYRKLARAVPPGQEPGRRRRRSAKFKEVQRAYDVLSDPEKRKQYDTFGSTNGRRPGPTNVDFGDFDLGDIFGGLFGGGRGRGRGGQAQQRGQRGSDVEVEVRISFEDSLKGLQTTVPGHARARLPHLPRHRRRARERRPKRCPKCEGTRRRRDLAGAVRPPAAVPDLPRQRHDRRHAVPDLPRLRPRAADEALHGADPGRRQGRHEDQAEGQGRGRLGRRARGRPVRRHAGRAVEALRAARRRPRARRAGHVRRGRARRDRRDPDARRPRVAQGAGGLAGREAAARQGPRRAEAERRRPRRPARAAARQVPAKLSKAEREALEGLEKASKTNPRERLFG